MVPRRERGSAGAPGLKKPFYHERGAAHAGKRAAYGEVYTDGLLTGNPHHMHVKNGGKNMNIIKNQTAGDAKNS